MAISKHLRGVHVAHHKNTSDSANVEMPVPDQVAISLSQHMGAPGKPLVKIGDTVKVGQKIADNEAFMFAPIHSSVSGVVKGFEDYTTAQGLRTQYIVIETDKLQTVSEEVAPPVINSREDFVTAIKNSGLVGLGGAGFPTHIKLSPKNLDAVDALVINGAECEPYITSDNREFLENGELVAEGIDLVRKYLDLKHVYVGIEKNKPKAIAEMQKLVASREGCEVVPLRAVYPQGGEKVIIYETTHRIVKEGQLPADVGVIVMNVTSIGFVAKYMRTGMPLVSKRITVDGTAIKEPKNVTVPIGARIKDVVEFCGGYSCEPKLILMGGPMMGTAVYDDSYSIVKNNNAILAFAEKDVVTPPESACIRCDRCVDHCPLNLMPNAIARAVKVGDTEELKALKVNLCMECGCCSFVCPAKRQLVLTNKLGKKMLRDSSKK